MTGNYQTLSKTQKVAALLIMIGTDAASEVLSHFDQAQLEVICREMAEFPLVDESMQQQLLVEFAGVVDRGFGSARGGLPFARETLDRTKGQVTTVLGADEEGENIDPSQQIRGLEGRQIVNLAKSEQPQTMAFILSFMEAGRAASLLAMFAPEVREEVVHRLAAMEATSQGVAVKLARNFNIDKAQEAKPQPLRENNGPETTVRLLKAFDKETRKTLLTSLEERDPELGAAIRRKAFSFDDLIRLSKTDLQRVLRDVDTTDLQTALKIVKPALLETMLAALSKRAAEALREELEMTGPAKAKDVDAAQDKIMQVVQRLEDAEEITIDAGEPARAAA